MIRKDERNTNRLIWLDYLSAIGTIMVFMQHSRVPKITRIILAFHMPLFFWISGYLYRVRESDRQCGRQYIVSKAKRLMLPHYFWMVVFQVTAYMKGTEISIKSIGHELLYCTSWFLPCMFISEIIVHFIIRKVEFAKNHSCLFALLFWGVSWIENQIMPTRSIFCLDTSLMAIGFIFAGFASAGVIDQLFSLSKDKKWLSTVFLAGGGTVCVLLNGPADVNFMMFQNQYGNYIFAILGALLLIAMLVFIVNLTEPILPRKYLGTVIK